jgi:hypothetical protein
LSEGRIRPEEQSVRLPTRRPNIQSLLQISAYGRYFHGNLEQQLGFPTEISGVRVLGWNSLFLDNQTTTLYCPVCRRNLTAEGVAYSSVVWCSVCFQWRKHGNSISKKRRHVHKHTEGELLLFIVASVLARLELVGNYLQPGDSFRAFDSLRKFSMGRNLLNRRQIVSIINLLGIWVVAVLHEKV